MEVGISWKEELFALSYKCIKCIKKMEGRSLILCIEPSFFVEELFNNYLTKDFAGKAFLTLKAQEDCLSQAKEAYKRIYFRHSHGIPSHCCSRKFSEIIWYRCHERSFIDCNCMLTSPIIFLCPSIEIPESF